VSTEPPTGASTGTPAETRLADGNWHRLHPATPILRGGIFMLVLAGWVFGQLREQFIQLLFGGPHVSDGDPVQYLTSGGRLPIAALAVAVILIVLVGIFYLSWRVHEFRITDELVEVRSGVIRRTNRKGRLDRIQGVNIVRPLFARIFGAARLEIDVAGHDANVRLDYLSGANADALRQDILRRASGTREREAAAAAAGNPATGNPGQVGVIDQRISEFLAPELHPSVAPPESVVKIHTGRLIGSLILHDTTLTFAVILIASAVVSAAQGHPFAIFIVVPFLFGIFSFLARRFTKSLRYSIAATPDGVRVGFGVLTLSNETLPPGRIHSVEVRQPILWRFPGWWEVRVNRASKSNAKGADGQRNTTILPVGNLDDVIKVLGLLLPGLVTDDTRDTVRRGIVARGTQGGFTISPKRARVIRWLSRSRNGFGFLPGVVLLRKGAIWRSLTIVPEPRVQSIAVHQGPLERALRLAKLYVHTVAGPIRADVGAIDRDVALTFFGDVSQQVVHSVNSDTTHRWRSGEIAGPEVAS
jgi:putative membrane protein